MKESWIQSTTNRIQASIDLQISSQGGLKASTIQSNRHLLRQVFKAHRTQILATFLITLLRTLLFLQVTFLSKQAIFKLAANPQDTQNSPGDQKRLNQVLQLVLVFAVSMIHDAVSDYSDYTQSKLDTEISVTLNTLIFKKAISTSFTRSTASGVFSREEITLMTTKHIKEAKQVFTYTINLVVRVVEILSYSYWIYTLSSVQNPIFYSILAVFLLFNWNNSQLFIKYYFEMLKEKQEMAKLHKEVFRNVKSIKMNVLENFFLGKLVAAKERVVGAVRNELDRNVLSGTLNHPFFPQLMASFLVVFTIWAKGGISHAEVFVVFRLIGPLLMRTRRFMTRFGRAKSSLKSLKLIWFFLAQVDAGRVKRDGFGAVGAESGQGLEADGTQSGEEDCLEVFVIEGGDFYWKNPARIEQYQQLKELNEGGAKSPSKSPKTQEKRRGKLKEENAKNGQNSAKTGQTDPNQIELALRDINLTIKKGSLTAIVGKVGSGKSSLLHALMSEMNQSVTTKTQTNGSISYVSQKPWLLSSSIKKNILLGQEFNQERYTQAVRSSCLDHDLRAMPEGDQTLLKGEDSNNISGGQKLRIALARAFYAEEDTYLLDDPFSALDHSVSQQVWKRGVLGSLAGKTRVIATNNLEFLSEFDQICVLCEGRVAVIGDFEQVKDHPSFLDVDMYGASRKGSLVLHQEIGVAGGGEDSREVDFGVKNENEGNLQNLKENAKNDGGKEKGGQERSQGGQRDKQEGFSFGRSEQAQNNTLGSFKQILSFWVELFGPKLLVIYIINMIVGSYLNSLCFNFIDLFKAQNPPKRAVGGLTGEESQSELIRIPNLAKFGLLYLGVDLLTTLTSYLRYKLNYVSMYRFITKLNEKMSHSFLHASLHKFYSRVKISDVYSILDQDVFLVDYELSFSTVSLFTQL